MTETQREPFKNPFRPGAGQRPPHLAGREEETDEFKKLLKQDVVIKNLILTGLRGTGKTVLLETFKPLAFNDKWLWVGTDLSESASVSEDTLAIRLLTDLSVVTSQIVVGSERLAGFQSELPTGNEVFLNYNLLVQHYSAQPGLVADKLKATLEWVWSFVSQGSGVKGLVFAYDEAQNMSDRTEANQYPLSVLLDVFQSLQRKGIPFLLVLVGLPTLFSKLVGVRTYSERMFDVLELRRLSHDESKDAITKPIEKENCPVKFRAESTELITKVSGGYPYFIQFICREVYDSFISQMIGGVQHPSVPITEIVAKLDSNFFAGRWSVLTDRQRELLGVVAALDHADDAYEFSIQEVVALAQQSLKNPIGGSQVNQMFSKLTEIGLLYKTRHGKYTLGIPLLGEFIKRQGVTI